MIVYHGTTLKRFENMVRDGVIFPRAKLTRNWHNYSDDLFSGAIRFNGIFVTTSKDVAESMLPNTYKDDSPAVILELHIGKRKVIRHEDKVLNREFYRDGKAYIIFAPDGIKVNAIRGATIINRKGDNNGY